ncbi:MAG: hypothetical protein ABR576_03955 [Thermoanaerobaculia bacterium]
MPGTLSVTQAPGRLEATLAGQFGNVLARYADGTLGGEGIRPLRVPAEDLRSLLAGIWRKGTPRVAGIDGDESLLTWEGPEPAEAVLDVSAGRLRSLQVSAGEGTLEARYGGEFSPWPARVELEDERTGHRLRLTMIAHERVP